MSEQVTRTEFELLKQSVEHNWKIHDTEAKTRLEVFSQKLDDLNKNIINEIKTIVPCPKHEVEIKSNAMSISRMHRYMLGLIASISIKMLFWK